MEAYTDQSPTTDLASQAAAICCRFNGLGELEVLLISSRERTWVHPSIAAGTVAEPQLSRLFGTIAEASPKKTHSVRKRTDAAKMFKNMFRTLKNQLHLTGGSAISVR